MTFFAESRMQFGGSSNIYRKSGFGLHQLRNCFHDEKTGIFGAGSTGKAMETERSASRRAAEATEGGIYGKAFRKRFQKS